MGVEWFYKHEGRVYGPLSLSDLRAALLLGFVSPSDLVCNREINGWRKASDLSELQTHRTLIQAAKQRAIPRTGLRESSPNYPTKDGLPALQGTAEPPARSPSLTAPRTRPTLICQPTHLRGEIIVADFPKKVSRCPCHSFTLVDFLVVNATNRMAAGLRLPAVQSALCLDRRRQCLTTLERPASWFVNHGVAASYFPTNRWWSAWLATRIAMVAGGVAGAVYEERQPKAPLFDGGALTAMLATVVGLSPAREGVFKATVASPF